jgi:hypothetical protein
MPYSLGQMMGSTSPLAALELQRGNMWGDIMQNIGQQLGHGVAMYQQQRAQDKQQEAFSKRDAAVSSLITQWDGQDPMQLLQGLAAIAGPSEGLKLANGVLAYHTLEHKDDNQPERAQAFLDAWPNLPEPIKGAFYPKARETVSHLYGFDPAQLPEQLTPEMDQAISAFSKKAKQQGKFEMAKTDQGLRAFDAATGSLGPVLAPAEKPEKADTRSIELQYADAVAKGDTTKAQQLLDAHKKMREAGTVVNVSGLSNLYKQIDTDAIADAIEAGTESPFVNQYGRPAAAAISSKLAKKGFNLSQAQMDWSATQKHLATLNGAQQVRMRQAAETAAHSLDVIDDLSQQLSSVMPRSQYPMLNRGALAAAKGGALGKDAQQIATQLEAQISDVTSELGNVYMGGNSPTDHALALAGKNLSADWSYPQLQAATKLARTNLRIRLNSMNTVGVAGASPDNPYAASPGVAPAVSPTMQPALRQGPTEPPVMKSPAEAAKLPPGTRYRTPDGRLMVR